MKGPNDYRDLVKKLRGETECYPDECEYCSAEGKCRCQRLGQACDAIEELVPYVESYLEAREIASKYLSEVCGPYDVMAKAMETKP